MTAAELKCWGKKCVKLREEFDAINIGADTFFDPKFINLANRLEDVERILGFTPTLRIRCGR